MLKNNSCNEDTHGGKIDFCFSEIKKLDLDSYNDFLKMASSNLDSQKNIKTVLKTEMAAHPDAFFFKAKAIEANIPNNNGDSFSVKELKKAMSSFVGVPFFTNHQNDDIEKAKGKVVYAEWNDEEDAIDVVAFIDKKAYPHLCRGIDQDYVTGVSMGASVEYSLCSICRNKAASPEEYCTHIRNLKGRKFTGRATDVITGETKEFKNAVVYEDNYGLRFIELSGVVDPACPTCKIKEKYKHDEFLKAASVNCLNSLYMFKTSKQYKESSEQDVQELNNVLETLQNISIKLIQNRKNIEMEFSTNLVKILADLQDYVDGLVQAGFGKLPDENQGVDPSQGMQDQGGQQPMGQPQVGGQGTMPISDEQPIGGDIGSVSGDDSADLVNDPQSFSEMVRPSPGGTQNSKGLVSPQRPSRQANNNGESDMRRIPHNTLEQKKMISESLQENWQEKIKKFSNKLKETIKDDITNNNLQKNKSGGSIMSKNTQAANSQQTSAEITERQLASKSIDYHPRTEKVDNRTGEEQLGNVREDGSANTTHEVILEDARTGSATPETAELMLKDLRDGEVKRQTVNEFLGDKRLCNEPNSTIENLLNADSIKLHMKAAVEVVAKTVTACQTTPERVLAIAGRMGADSISKQLNTIREMNEAPAMSNEDFNKRASFWSDKGLKIASASDIDIKNAIMCLAGKYISDDKINGELLLKSFLTLKNNVKSPSIISSKVKDIIKDTNTENVDVYAQMNNELDSMSTSDDKDEDKDFPNNAEALFDPGKKVKPPLSKSTQDVDKDVSEESVLAETKSLMKAINSSTSSDNDVVMIETSFDEMGVPTSKRQDDNYIKSAVSAFAHGACANLGVKVSAVVNVTIDGESGDVVIAVDTENGSIEIPTKEEVVDDVGSSDDVDFGEGLSDDMGEQSVDQGLGTDPDLSQGMDTDFQSPVQPGPGQQSQGVGAFSSAKRQNIKKSQFGGGSPGAGIGAEDPNVGSAQTGDTLMETPPGEGEGLSSFTEEEEVSLPGDEKQLEPGSICPMCGSTDTESGRKDQSPGQFDCNSCGAKYTFHVNIEVLNPQELFNKEVPDSEIKEPTVPSMPVAAMVKLDRAGFKKMASVYEDIKAVCPACGSVDVKLKGSMLDSKITCASCKTVASKEVLINTDDPSDSAMRVSWEIDPMNNDCEVCKNNAKKAASDRVFNAMLRVASKKEFPEQNVRSWLEENYSNVEYVTNGPFKGDKFADTIVRQLKTFALNKVKYLKSLAEVQSSEDPLDTCVKDHKKKGYTLAESNRLCNCLKQKFASEVDENIYAQAFSGMVHGNILKRMASYDKMHKNVKLTSNAVSIDDDMPLDSLSLPVKKDVHADSLRKAIVKDNKKKASCKEVKDIETVLDGKGAPKGVNHVKLDKPKVPRGDATMGNEEPAPKEGVSVPSKGDSDISSTGQNSVEATSQETGNIKTSSDKEIQKVESLAEVADVKNDFENCKGPDVPEGDAKMGEEKEIEAEEEIKVPSEDNETDLTMKGEVNVEAERNKQMDKIVTARREQAIKYAGQLIGKGILKESESESFVNDLSSFPLDRMKNHVDMIISSRENKREMSSEDKMILASLSLTTPIVKESELLVEKEEPSFTEQLSEMFTIAGPKNDRYIRKDISER